MKANAVMILLLGVLVSSNKCSRPISTNECEPIDGVCYVRDSSLVKGFYIQYACEKCARFKLDSKNDLDTLGDHIFIEFADSFPSSMESEDSVFNNIGNRMVLLGRLSAKRYINPFTKDWYYKFLVLSAKSDSLSLRRQSVTNITW